MREVVQARGETVEAFMDEVIALANIGFTRVDTLELAMSVQTNYWQMSLIAPEEVVEAQEVVENEEVKKAGKPAKTKV